MKVQSLIPRVSRVKGTISGKHAGKTGLVVSIDMFNNSFSVIFDGTDEVVLDCLPDQFEIVEKE